MHLVQLFPCEYLRLLTITTTCQLNMSSLYGRGCPQWEDYEHVLIADDDGNQIFPSVDIVNFTRKAWNPIERLNIIGHPYHKYDYIDLVRLYLVCVPRANVFAHVFPKCLQIMKEEATLLCVM